MAKPYIQASKITVDDTVDQFYTGERNDGKTPAPGIRAINKHTGGPLVVLFRGVYVNIRKAKSKKGKKVVAVTMSMTDEQQKNFKKFDDDLRQRRFKNRHLIGAHEDKSLKAAITQQFKNINRQLKRLKDDEKEDFEEFCCSHLPFPPEGNTKEDGTKWNSGFYMVVESKHTHDGKPIPNNDENSRCKFKKIVRDDAGNLSAKYCETYEDVKGRADVYVQFNGAGYGTNMPVGDNKVIKPYRAESHECVGVTIHARRQKPKVAQFDMEIPDDSEQPAAPDTNGKRKKPSSVPKAKKKSA